MMDMNNNDFFGEVNKDEFDNENMSNSGINYGEDTNKSSAKTYLIAIAAGAIVAGVVLLLFTSNKGNNQATNLAEIPTISSPSSPIKEIPEEEKTNKVFEQASVYAPTSFDEEAKTLISAEKIVKPTPIPVVEKREVKVVPVKKPAPVKIIVKKDSAPKIIEKKTNVKGEVEVSSVKSAPKKTPQRAKSGVWNVQLISTSSEASANKEWTNLSKKYPSILKNLNHSVSRTEVNGKIYYRLRITNLDSSATATDICNKLKANKLSCFVTK